MTDPRSDLAQTFQMFDSYGLGALRPRIVEAYQAASGAPLHDMDFFDVFASLKHVAGQYAVLDDCEHKRPAVWAALSRRPGWEARAAGARAQAPTVERIYRKIVELAGVRVPEVEAAFARARG